MNESAVRGLAGVPSGAITMNDFYGKSDIVIANITLAANTTNYVLNTAKVTGYVAGKTRATLTINSGVFVSSTSTGSYALQVDTSWNASDTVTIVNNGTIVGRGGDAGAGGSGPNAVGGNGATAGPALLVQRATSLNNVNRIAGGGGGGGGSSGYTPGKGWWGGAGGGGGIGVSSGGAAGSGPNGSGGAGSPGTLTAGGAGGVIPGFGFMVGGNGGGYGSGGGNGAQNAWSRGFGGGAGAAIVGNSNITYIATGTINGSIS
jgi:hypothetical protein